jgi:hypothetical protein
MLARALQLYARKFDTGRSSQAEDELDNDCESAGIDGECAKMQEHETGTLKYFTGVGWSSLRDEPNPSELQVSRYTHMAFRRLTRKRSGSTPERCLDLKEKI